MKHLFACLLLFLPVCGSGQMYTIKQNHPVQTIAHFGASDAWSMQRIGLWEEEEEVTKIADWLFSTEMSASGQPLGIGLSLWRFNLGAGSAEQGDSSHINMQTRTECFLNYDGTYDWSRQAGQRRFLQLAKERGVEKILAFLNSPPVYFTQNELATNTGRDGTLNLRQECYDDFAQFMAEAVQGLEREHGIHVDYLSPVNEPDGHWNWQGPKQEGTPATNSEIAEVVRHTSKALSQRGLSTQIVVNESSDLRCLLGVYKTSWERGNAIAAFFSKDSTATYIGNLPNVAPLMAAHSYWTNTPIDQMKTTRLALRDRLKKYKTAFWQSEICIMDNDVEIGGGQGYDFGINTALYVARIIHHDLTCANAESWSWWRACGGDYKDGLIRIYEGRDHRARESRLLWALGNYSRFIRPGAVRLDMTCKPKEDPQGIMPSAYRNTDGSLVCVVINYSTEKQPFNLRPMGTWTMYRTSDAAGETLKPIGTTDGGTILAPRSITTFVAKKGDTH